jgi:hypothetical protein
MFRMERVQNGEAVCVLVHRTGAYRLEKLFRAKLELYGGTLDPADAEKMAAILGEPKLTALTQQQISSPLMRSTDDVQLAIWRDTDWQQLTFYGKEGRKPYRDFMDPLLNWLQEVGKYPNATRLKGPATRCIPAKSEMPLVTASLAQSSTSPYLFWLESEHFYKSIDQTCTVVFPDGSYHWEHSEQPWDGPRRDMIATGKVSEAALQNLRTVLDSPDLKNAPDTKDGTGRTAREWYGLKLQIPRESRTQKLYFEEGFNTVNVPREPGGMSNLQYQVSDSRVAEPIKEWIKSNGIPPRDAVREGKGNNCWPKSEIEK